MSYFQDHAARLRYSLAAEGEVGLRRPQAGALHAVAAHFSTRVDPALVCMPTGSGKTLVLLACPYALEAKRALVITPSVVVRGQIAEGAADARELIDKGMLPEDVASPNVVEVKKRIASDEDWEELRAADLVVATPHTVSQIYESVPTPPEDLFDVVLVDEAHHEAARGWREALDSFPRAKRVLFSATPFRRDRKEIRGRFVFNYTLGAAFADGVFGPVRLVPARGDAAVDPDRRVAETAAAQYRADRQAGLDHRIMVRTGSKTRAKELEGLYRTRTDLRLKIVTSDHSYRHAQKVLRDIRDDELDGVICVDMFGEGFDLPQLKVAALHEPHKSLAVTLQFFGRFARVRDATGDASIVAVPHELDRGVSKLFHEDATWPKLLMDFAGTAIGHEQHVREDIASFEEPQAVEQLENLSLYGLRPFCHSKIYRGLDEADITAQIGLPKPYEVVFQQASPDLNMSIVIGRKLQRPKWTDSDSLVSVQYELFACYYDGDSKLLFICASARTDSFYEAIANQLGDGSHQILSASRISRVLRGVEVPRFFHVGMKNNTASSSLESYVTKSGPRAHESVSPQEGQLYHRGHIMAKGRKENADVTIGYSSSSRVWSMQYPQLTEWREWCRALGQSIANDQPVVTGTNLDILEPGDEVNAFPLDVLAAEWPEEAFRKAVMLRYRQSAGDPEVSVLLQDVGIDVDFAATPPGTVPTDARLLVRHEALDVSIWFAPGGAPMFRVDGETPAVLEVDVGGDQVELVDYLNSHPVALWLSDCSRLEGSNLYRRRADKRPIDNHAFTAVDWGAIGVSINREYEDGQNPVANDGTVHGYILGLLESAGASVIIYDHGSHEAADVIGIWDEETCVRVRLYHCKATRGEAAGCRLDDLYEVAAQAVKSVRWLHKPAELLEHLDRRSNGRPYRFQRGRLREVQQLLQSNPKHAEYEVVVVQPGLSMGSLTKAAQDVLAAANQYLWRDTGNRHLRVIASP